MPRSFQPSTPPIVLSAAGSRPSTGISFVFWPSKRSNNGAPPATRHLRTRHNFCCHNRRACSVASRRSSSCIVPVSTAAQPRSKTSMDRLLQSLCLIWQHRSSFPSQRSDRSTVESTAGAGTAISTDWPFIAFSSDDTFRTPPYPFDIAKHRPCPTWGFNENQRPRSYYYGVTNQNLCYRYAVIERSKATRSTC